eukprot:m.69445 g.69445  ORF g.69445 m.69445 type:complete len:787 (-) comp12056_c0_seq4:2575-4935(-)
MEGDVRCLYSGWLEKQGGTFTGWKRRFFELRPNGLLEYRRKEGGGLAVGHIQLRGATVHLTYTENPDGTLEISSPAQQRIFYIRGEPDAVQRWEDVLQNQMKTLAPVLPPVPEPEENDVEEVSMGWRKVYKAGWLEKRGKLNKAWKRRWFQLKDARLEYYKSPHHDEPQGAILIAEGSSALKTVEGSSKYSHYIEISSVEGRVYYISSFSLEELRAWLAALQPRHRQPRVTNMHMCHSSVRPKSGANVPPPQVVDVWAYQKPFLHRLVKHSLLKMTPAHKVCKIGCGGVECRHCDPLKQVGEGLNSAVRGLHASWVTQSVLASSRPSNRLVEEYDIINQLRKLKVTAIFNVQQEGEHAHCGDGLIEDKFSYTPDIFVKEGISVYLYGWQDFGIPTHESLFKMVKVISDIVEEGGRVLVHCHAGLGRTGMLIACHLVYSLAYSAEEAVTVVRLRRAKAIQTKAQISIVKEFERFLSSRRVIFTDVVPNKEGLSLTDAVAQETSTMSVEESQTLGGQPKLLAFACKRVKELCNAGDIGTLVDIDIPADCIKRRLDAKRKINNGDWHIIEQCSDAGFVYGLIEDWLRQLATPVLKHSDCVKVHNIMELDTKKIPAELTRGLENAVLLNCIDSIKAVVKDPVTMNMKFLIRRLAGALIQAPMSTVKSEGSLAALDQLSQVILWLCPHAVGNIFQTRRPSTVPIARSNAKSFSGKVATNKLSFMKEENDILRYPEFDQIGRTDLDGEEEEEVEEDDDDGTKQQEVQNKRRTMILESLEELDLELSSEDEDM